jgi:hypothetical protein
MNRNRARPFYTGFRTPPSRFETLLFVDHVLGLELPLEIGC